MASLHVASPAQGPQRGWTSARKLRALRGPATSCEATSAALGSRSLRPAQTGGEGTQTPHPRGRSVGESAAGVHPPGGGGGFWRRALCSADHERPGHRELASAAAGCGRDSGDTGSPSVGLPTHSRLPLNSFCSCTSPHASPVSVGVTVPFSTPGA